MKKRTLLAASIAATVLAATGRAQTRPIALGVALASDTNPFYVEVKKGIEARAKELGWRVSFVSANEVVSVQNDGIGDLIAKKVDAIIVSPIDTAAVVPSYEAARKAGIPIISVVRTVQSPSQRVAVTGDFRKIGIDTGRWMAKAIQGKGQVAMVAGPAGAELFRNFAAGFEEGLKASPDIQVVFRKEGPLTREFGLRMAEDILVAHPNVRGIYCGNDEIALGAVQAVAAAGKRGQVLVTGSNAVPAALRAVKAGALGMTVDLQPRAWGALGVDTLARVLKGESVPPIVGIDYLIVDQGNVDRLLAGAK